MKRFLLVFLLAFECFAIDMTPKQLKKIPMTETMYNSQQTDVLISNAGKVQKIVAGENITVSPSSGEGNVTISSTGTAKKKIAMFILKMNDTSSADVVNNFAVFELKATTNNFTGTTSPDQRTLYYTHSSHADVAGISNNDKCRIYINHGGNDVRSYKKIANTLDVTYAPESYVVLVDATQCWSERSDGKWLDSEDDNLMWTYIKTKNGTREPDAGSSTVSLWRPVMPVRWFNELPNWAEEKQ